MGSLKFLNEASAATPASGYTTKYVDSADKKAKTIDQNGVISTLNNDGLKNRNIVTNGGFAIQQKVAAASTLIAALSTTTRAGVVADCWSITTSVATNLNWQQVDTNGAQDTGLQSRFYGSIISSVAGKKVMISQYILGSEMAHLRGKKVRVSIKHNQKVGSGQTFHLGLLQLTSAGTVDVDPAFLTGAWSTSTGVAPVWGTNLAAIAPDSTPTGENGTVNGSYLDITSVATTWTRSSCVFTVPTSAKNLVVVFFSDATGGTTDNISIAEVQLTEGPDIVDYCAKPEVEELVRCQRRFCKSFPLTVVPAANLSEATAGSGVTGLLGKSGSATALGSQISIQFPVQMTKTPTVTLFTPTGAGAVVFRLTGTTPAVQGATAIRTNSTTDRGCVVTATNEASTNGAVGDLVAIHYTASTEFVN